MLVRELSLPFEPAAHFARLFAAHEDGFLLESAEGPERLARYSILGLDPVGKVRLEGDRLRIDGELPAHQADEPPLEYLRRLLALHPTTDHGYRYLGGLVGYSSYELTERLERLTPRAAGAGFPTFEYGLYLDGLVYDRLTRRVVYFSHGKDRSAELAARALEKADVPAPHFGAPKPNVDAARFEKMVENAKHHITEGDIFQVVLSRRFDLDVSGDLLGYYEALKKANPSPYMYYLKNGERKIVGASPEMLVRVDGGRVETFPIAGTRPMGRTLVETEMLAKELLADAKEAAEHAMLVDLARNDVGRVAEFGTVKVSESRKIERFSHVQHLVSKVEARLRPGRSAIDAFAALFPAGTVSGAPKVRAMELIRELEADARGPYAGAVGYFSFNGNADAAIAIRTLSAHGTKASVQAGAGIVHDSVPEAETRETEAKARGLLAVAEAFR
ncbi:MAG TPA: anthranilate synthase component I family protein [Candidatus Thermoplasmatota archaeon]|nr:anthranilate synthase component I family protein [Candidatus Thermoplasmatota archaeon]